MTILFRPSRRYGAGGIPREVVDAMWAHYQRSGSLLATGKAFGRAAGWAAVEEHCRSLVAGRLTAPAVVKLPAFLTSPESALLLRSHDRGLVELCLQALFIEKEGIDPKQFAVKSDGRDHFRALQPERVEKVRRLFQAGNNQAER